MTLVICNGYVAEIWVNGRAPIIAIRDYDEGETDQNAMQDQDGFAFSQVNWNAPAWTLGLSLQCRYLD